MKQYFSYFKVLYIILGVMIVLTGGLAIVRSLDTGSYVRTNHNAPEERVYDYADVLSESEETSLRELIAKREAEIGCDIILVTLNESVLEKYGLTYNSDSNWYSAMRNYADDFFDYGYYGFNSTYVLDGKEGDGVLLLDNWYTGDLGSEMGSWLSTSGRVEKRYSSTMIDNLLDGVDARVESSPYSAYKFYVESVARTMSGRSISINLNPAVLFLIAAAIAGIFVLSHLKSKEGEKTTTDATYVEKGSIKYNVNKDELINKFVTSRVIETSSGGSGGSGGGGHHHSSSGASHGGGGHRR